MSATRRMCIALRSTSPGTSPSPGHDSRDVRTSLGGARPYSRGQREGVSADDCPQPYRDELRRPADISLPEQHDRADEGPGGSSAHARHALRRVLRALVRSPNPIAPCPDVDRRTPEPPDARGALGKSVEAVKVHVHSPAGASMRHVKAEAKTHNCHTPCHHRQWPTYVSGDACAETEALSRISCAEIGSLRASCRADPLPRSSRRVCRPTRKCARSHERAAASAGTLAAADGDPVQRPGLRRGSSRTRHGTCRRAGSSSPPQSPPPSGLLSS